MDCFLFASVPKIHWPDRYAPTFGRRIFDKEQIRESVAFEEQLRAMAELIKEGKIRAWGVSNETTFGESSSGHQPGRWGQRGGGGGGGGAERRAIGPWGEEAQCLSPGATLLMLLLMLILIIIISSSNSHSKMAPGQQTLQFPLLAALLPSCLLCTPMIMIIISGFLMIMTIDHDHDH